MADDLNTIEPATTETPNPSTEVTETNEYAVTDPSDVKIPDVEPEKTESDEVVFSAEILERAALHDLSEEDLRPLGSEKAVSAMLNIRDREERAERTTPSRTITTTNTVKSEKLTLKLGELMDDDTRGAFNAVVDELNRTKDELAASRELMENAANSNRGARINMILDAEKDYDAVVGSAHPRNRAKVIEYIDTLEAGYKARGKSAPSESALAKQALSALYPNHNLKVIKQKSQAAIDKMTGQAISRPSQRNGTRHEPNALQELRAIRERAAARG